MVVVRSFGFTVLFQPLCCEPFSARRWLELVVDVAVAGRLDVLVMMMHMLDNFAEPPFSLCRPLRTCVTVPSMLTKRSLPRVGGTRQQLFPPI